jgi:hypothetical protein
MAKQLLALPLDRGIDQSKATGGGEPAVGLVACENLWHAKRGELSTRPGTARAGGVIPESNPDHVFTAGIVGERAILLGDDSKVLTLSRPRTANEDQSWVVAGLYSSAVPVARRELTGYGSNEQLTKEVAIWRHLMLVAEDDGTDMTVTAYDRTTGYQLSQTVYALRRGGVWAHHGNADDAAPTLFARDDVANLNQGGIWRHVIEDTALGIYDTGTSLNNDIFTSALTDILAVGHTTGGAHIGLSDGRLYYLATQASALSTLTATGVTLASSYGTGTGTAWFAGSDTGTLTVAKVVTSTVTTDTQTVTENGVVLAPHGANDVGAYLFPAGGAPGNTYRCITSGITGTIGSEVLYMYDAAPRGGAYFLSGSGSFLWFTLNVPSSTTGRPFQTTALVDLTAVVAAAEPSIVMTADVIIEPGTSSEHLPQAAWDGLGGFACLHQGLLDLENDNSAKNVAFEWTHTTRPIIADVAGHPLISGGIMSDVTGEAGPTLLPIMPRITATVQGTSGSLTAEGIYQYIAIFEQRDSSGTVRRGLPSQVAEVTLTGSNDSVAVTTRASTLVPDGWEVVIYRTEANGSIFYRDSGEGDDLAPGDTFTSIQDDDNLSNNPIAYFEGGTLFNGAAPSHSILATGKHRAWVAGQWRRYRLQFSKETLPGEVPAFPDDPTHWMDLDQDITGIAVMDDVVLAFHRDSVTLVSGDGPNAQGIGAFQARPCTIGVGADSHHTIAVTPVGVFFAGQGTIWLMGRGFAAPENLGAQVQDILEDYPSVLCARLVDYGQQQCVQFICQNADETETTRLVFSLRSLSWYQWDGLSATALGETFVRDTRRLCLLSESASIVDGEQLLCESAGTTDDDIDDPDAEAVPIATAIETHDIHPWGLASDARVQRVWFRSRVAEEQTWNYTEIHDGGRSNFPSNGRHPQVKTGYQVAEYRFKEQACQSIALRLDAGPVTLAGAMIEVEAEGAPKLATGERRG